VKKVVADELSGIQLEHEGSSQPPANYMHRIILTGFPFSYAGDFSSSKKA
jgi:hypothetical protein